MDRLPQVVGRLLGVSILPTLVACTPPLRRCLRARRRERPRRARLTTPFIGGLWLASLVLWRQGSLAP